MPTFIGSSDNLLLFTEGPWGVVIDADLSLVVASGAATVLCTSRTWNASAGDVSESSALADLTLGTLVASASGSSSKYTIPKAVQEEAEKALSWRADSGRGGTSVGINTARTLVAGGQVGIEKVRHIAKYFPRHEVDKKAEGWKPADDSFPSNGRIAWALWGGDAGKRWATTIVEREDKKALQAAGYDLSESMPMESIYVDSFDREQDSDADEYAPEFFVRVRLDGSGMDRLYKVDGDKRCYVWDDGSWDDLGMVSPTIWDYDDALDSADDLVGISHIEIDPDSAIVMAAKLYSNPSQFVSIEDIDEEEANLAVYALDEIDWELLDRSIVAAGVNPDDGVYSPEERAENATRQVRDATGKFAKTGSRVMVGGDQNRLGEITKVDPARGTVTVKMDSGEDVEVGGKGVQPAPAPAAPVSAPEPGIIPERKVIDTSGILGEPRTPSNRTLAQIPGTLPALTAESLSGMLSDWPAWVKEQRDSFVPGQGQQRVSVQGRDSTDTGPMGQRLKDETGKSLLRSADEHPLLKKWLNHKDSSGFTPNRLWYQPIISSAEQVVELTPDTSDVQPAYMAVVDPDDPRAVLALVSLVPASSLSNAPMAYSREEGKWVRDPKTLADLNSATPPPVIPLSGDDLNDVLSQVDETQGVAMTASASLALSVLFGPSLVASADIVTAPAVLVEYFSAGEGATQIRWGEAGDWKRCVSALSETMEFRAKGYCQMLQQKAGVSEEMFVTEADMHTPLAEITVERAEFQMSDTISALLSDSEGLFFAEYSLVAAGGADRNRGGAENLRRYWTVGKGALKIRWGTGGDWTRCVRNLKKYMGPRAKGYCALRHKEMNGIWPGDRRNQKNFGVFDGTELRTEEQIIVASALHAQKNVLSALVASLRAGEDKHTSVSNFFLKDPIVRTAEMEDAVEDGVPVDAQDIDISDLIPSQRTVNMERVESVEDSDAPVSVVITDVGPVLVDGHHRTAAYRIRGEDVIPAKIYQSLLASGAVMGARFAIPLVIPESLESGDGRRFRSGAIEIRELPLPLLWQIKTGDGHDGSVVVGRIDFMERTEDGIGNAHGYFDTGEYGREAERLVRGGFLRGVSADMDKFEATEEAEEATASDEEDKKIKKDKIVISNARVMAVTIVPKPAFQECKIMLDEELNTITQEDEMIPDGVYVEDVDPTDAEAIVASGLIAGSIPVTPPKDWFSNPKLTQPTPITVDDSGRVFGHIAAWNVDHIGMSFGTKPPRSRSKYAYFHTGVVRTEEGNDVPVGQLTLAGGHADIRATAELAVKHYDDTASAVADVHAGEDQFGIWVSGALRPGVTPEQVRTLRASAPSGDWRPIRGALELVAVCQVNVPGFPVARAMVASGQITALVAAGASAMARLRHNPVEDLNYRLSRLEAKEGAEALLAAASEARAKFASLKSPTSALVSAPADSFRDRVAKFSARLEK